MTQLEDLVVEIREVLSEKMLELGLERQAITPAEERPTAFQHCSGCGQPTPPDPEEPLEPRLAWIPIGPLDPNKVAPEGAC